eukprot:4408838-Alexandrium_andersonii.AAC.1
MVLRPTRSLPTPEHPVAEHSHELAVRHEARGRVGDQTLHQRCLGLGKRRWLRWRRNHLVSHALAVSAVALLGGTTAIASAAVAAAALLAGAAAAATAAAAAALARAKRIAAVAATVGPVAVAAAIAAAARAGVLVCGRQRGSIGCNCHQARPLLG